MQVVWAASALIRTVFMRTSSLLGAAHGVLMMSHAGVSSKVPDPNFLV
jgi:hypothetical protein